MTTKTLSIGDMKEEDIEKLCQPRAGGAGKPVSTRMNEDLLAAIEQSWREKYKGLPFVMGQALNYFAARGVLSYREEAQDSKRK